jgi:hypothetical protein
MSTRIGNLSSFRHSLLGRMLAATAHLTCVTSLVLAAGPAAAAEFGSFQADMCRGENGSGQGVRQHSAILWGIPWGYSWEQACAETSATVAGQYFSSPDRCVNFGPGINMWGEFDVVDPSCQVDREEVENEIADVMGIAELTCDRSHWPSDGCSNPFADPVSKQYRDEFNSACVFHDYCYASPWGQTYGRAACDMRFFELMVDICHPDDVACNGAAVAFCGAVDAFGHAAYENAQNAVSNGQVTCSMY